MDQLFLWQSIFGEAKLEDLNGQKEITLVADIKFQRQVRPRCDLVACPKDIFSTFATTPSNHLVLEKQIHFFYTGEYLPTQVSSDSAIVYIFGSSRRIGTSGQGAIASAASFTIGSHLGALIA
jgi:hypothetical protein